jgi:hypothetical protein
VLSRLPPRLLSLNRPSDTCHTSIPELLARPTPFWEAAAKQRASGEPPRRLPTLPKVFSDLGKNLQLKKLLISSFQSSLSPTMQPQSNIQRGTFFN